MIDHAFWEKVARKWTTESDGVEIPEAKPIDDNLGLDDFDDITDELDDILADLVI